MDIEKRLRMAAESILENEAIREDIDDSGASALLDWGVSCAVQIMQDTSNLEDDEEAQEAVYPRMRALRQMLEIVKSLNDSETTSAEGVSFLAELLEKAALVYGEKETLPEQIYWNTLSATKVEDTGQNINTLRDLIEKNIPSKE
jgi:hypothetical protein